MGASGLVEAIDRELEELEGVRPAGSLRESS
jgi:hypothetical protein